MSKKIIISVFFAVICCISLSAVSFAQEITGSIVGTVRDSNGAGVPNATVSVSAPSQGDAVIRTVVTDNDGTFSVPGIGSRVYKVTVEAPNFKKSVSTDVKVDIGQRRQIDVTLTAGKINETVTVTADAVSVELSTPTVGTTINGDQVRELSVNNRNFVQLVTLAPGVSNNLADQVYVGTTNPDGQANTVQISVNGARSSQNTFTVDGADITDRGSNLTIQAYPSIDSIGEFRVLRSLYPAESGRSGGGQVNVVTRSGGDQFHGSLFEFVRNEKFNAGTYLNNRNAPLGRDANGKSIRPPFRYNNYGFTIGGPIYFLNFGEHDPSDPFFAKLHRTYFFFSEEQRKDRRFPSLVAQVPNAGLKAGVFSVPICLSGTITGTVRTCSAILPAGQAFSTMAAINPLSQAYLTNIFNKIPLPNNGVFGLNSAASGKADFQQEIVKIDTAFTDKWTAYYRYQRDSIPTIDVNSLFSSGSGIPNVSTSSTDSPGRTHTLQTDYVVSPNFIIEARFTYSYGAILSHTTGLLSKAASPGISTPLPYPSGDDRVPHLSITNLNGLVAFGPYNNFSNKKDFSTNATYIFGGHTTKFGVSYSRYRKNENALGGSNQGAFSAFNNTTAASATQGLVCLSNGLGTNPPINTPIACPTGQQTTEQSFANFLLGTNAAFTQSKYDLTADFRQQNLEAFAQDEYKVKSNLTFYYGVRYSFFGSPWDKNGLLSNFVPKLYNAANAPVVTGAGLRVAGSGNWCDGMIVNSQNFATGPAAYNCNPTASPYGKFVVNSKKNNFAPRIGIAWDPFKKGTTVIRTGYGIYHEQTLVGTFEQNLAANPPYQETVTVSGVNISNPVPTVGGVVVSASPPGAIRAVDTNYLTPYMQHWSLDIQHQFGRNTIVTVGYYGSKGTHLIGIADLNNLRPGDALAKQCAVGTSTTPTQACQLRDVNSVPISFTSAASELILDQIRPYRGWKGIAYIEPRYNSNYNSLQVSAQHRFSGSSQVNLAYTWSKNITDNQTDRSTAPMNYYDTKADKGLAALDRRHITTVNYIYELPFYKTQKDFVGKVLGGWQASGIVTYQTGLPFTPTYSSFDPAGLGFLNGSSPAGGRPYWYSDPNTGAPHTFQQWFNTAAFQSSTPLSAPAVVTNAGRGIIEGPPTFRVDFTLTKNVRFTESLRLQLKAEAFNILNHTNFTTLGTAASTPSTFGTVTGTRDPRTMQFGIKLLF
ncbi:MAG: carboxypeptidase regulatory-like domain-containing protein [Acidobacteriota bacterium]